MIKQLYLAIERKLMAITDGQTDPQPLFRHFDLWNRQVEFVEQETPFQTPAVFVEFAPLQWRQMLRQVQDADLTVRLHIVTPWYANTAAYIQNQEVRDTALAYLDLPTLVYRQLSGQWAEFGLGSFNGMVRTASTVNHDHERYIDSVEEYQCHLKDLSIELPTFAVSTVGLQVMFSDGNTPVEL